MLNFTFFPSVNAIPVKYNCYFIYPLICLLIFCIVFGYIKRHNIWIRSLAITLGLWFTAGLGLYWVEPNNFITDWINSAVAIGTIALAIFGWMAYKYATRDYIKQKGIDHSIDSAKKVIAMLFFHKSNLSTIETLINRSLATLEIGIGTINTFSTEEIAKLQDNYKLFEPLVNQFTDDWKLSIGTELTLLKILRDDIQLNQLSDNINTSITNIARLKTQIEQLSPNQPTQPMVTNVNITENILSLHNYVKEILKSIYHVKP